MKFRGRKLSPVAVAVVLLATFLGACDDASRPTAAQLRSEYEAGVVFVDVRSPEEWSAGHLQAALHMPVDAVADTAAVLLPDKNAPIVTYCKAGGRARAAAEKLRGYGYTKVTAMDGGYDDLEAAGFPIAK